MIAHAKGAYDAMLESIKCVDCSMETLDYNKNIKLGKSRTESTQVEHNNEPQLDGVRKF